MVDFTDANKTFNNLNLRGHDFSKRDLSGASFVNADLEGANLRGCILSGVDFSGANLYCANLEDAIVENIIYNEETRYFKILCPAEGAFLGFKKCFNFRIVQLLIPADAKRLSATSAACRCDKAKVLSIKSLDYSKSYTEARSYFNEDFIYKTGETVYADAFCEDRWRDSTNGIHFYLTRAEALRYL